MVGWLRKLGEWAVAGLRSPRTCLHLALLLSLGLIVNEYFDTFYKAEFAHEVRGDGIYRPILAVQDGHMLYLQVLTLVYDRDFDISDEVELFGRTSNEYKTDDGRPYYPSPIGSTLVWAPALVFAHGLATIGNWFGAQIPTHGYTYFHQRIVFLTSPILAWLAAVIAFVVCRRLFGGRFAPILAALATLFGTNLYYYGVERPDYGHALSAAVCAVFLGYWALTVGRMTRRRFAIAGALAGACGLCRITDLGLGIVVAFELLWYVAARVRQPERWEAVRRAVVLGAVAFGMAVLVFFVQLVAWKLHCGTSLFEIPKIEGFMDFRRPQILLLLFSRMNGYLSTHPIAYFGALGLLVLPRRHRLVGLGLFVAVALEVYINSCAWDWHATGSYGNRRMICVSLAVGVGLCAWMHVANRLLSRVPAWIRVAVASIVLSWFVVWNLVYAGPIRKRKTPTPPEICCDELPDFMKDIAKPIYEDYGNPFAFPANVWFKYKWGVDLKRWDQAATNFYGIRISLDDYRYEKKRDKWHSWNLAGASGMQPFLLRGYGPHQPYRIPGVKKPKYVRWLVSEHGEALIPLFLGGTHNVELPVYPNLAPGEPAVMVSIAVNNHVYWQRELSRGWTTAKFTIPGSQLARGMNLLEIRGPPPRPNRTGDLATGGLPSHPKNQPVSVAVGKAQLQLQNPKR